MQGSCIVSIDRGGICATMYLFAFCSCVALVECQGVRCVDLFGAIVLDAPQKCTATGNCAMFD